MVNSLLERADIFFGRDNHIAAVQQLDAAAIALKQAGESFPVNKV